MTASAAQATLELDGADAPRKDPAEAPAPPELRIEPSRYDHDAVTIEVLDSGRVVLRRIGGRSFGLDPAELKWLALLAAPAALVDLRRGGVTI